MAAHNGELSPTATRILKTLVDLDEAAVVRTVQAVAIHAQVDYSTVSTVLNELFAAGLVGADLGVTEKGRKAAA